MLFVDSSKPAASQAARLLSTDPQSMAVLTRRSGGPSRTPPVDYRGNLLVGN